MFFRPNLLSGDVIRITLEARAIGPDPILQISFGTDAEFSTVPSAPVNLEEDWMRYQFTLVRSASGVPMGRHLDMFIYSGRDVEVRFFEAHDLGVKGDMNLDCTVDILDAAIVLSNYPLTGNTNFEDGDTNLDGTVDIQDITNVLDAINE